ncbi:unnamed protein product [Durusdinium trenchii]|uniref:Uncharacterized protein n=2 Tax=Durusdinium trenchii TaxID=1381693 RepID=A0ABP0SY75_9DINO
MVRVMSLSGAEIMSRTEVLQLEELWTEVAAALGHHCRLLRGGEELTDAMTEIAVEDELTAIICSIEPWMKMLGLLQEDGTPFSEAYSRGDLETMALKLGRAILSIACCHGRVGHLEGYLSVDWPFGTAMPKAFAESTRRKREGELLLTPDREILPAGARLRISCAEGTHGEESVRTLSKAMTLQDLLELQRRNPLDREEMIKLLASPKAVECQAEEVHRLVKVVDFEPPEVHLQLAYEFCREDDFC